MSIRTICDRYFVQPYTLGKDLQQGKLELRLPRDFLSSPSSIKTRVIQPIVALSLRIFIINSIVLALLDITRVRFVAPPKAQLELDVVTYRRNGLTDVLKALQENSATEELRLCDIENESDFKLLCAAIKSHPGLKRLIFDGAQLNDERLTQLALALKNHKTVCELTIARNRQCANYKILFGVKRLTLAESNILSFSSAVPDENYLLEKLIMDDFHFDVDHITSLVGEIKKPTQVILQQSLKCFISQEKQEKRQKEFPEITFQTWAQGLTENTIRTLKLMPQKGDLSKEEIHQLARGLQNNTSLEALDLSGAGIDDEKIAEIAVALKGHPSLSKLKLGVNKITGKGAASLRMLLESSTSLRELDLNYNPLGDEGASEIAAALPKNSSLRLLDLGLTSLTGKGVTTIATQLKRNSTLQTLIFDGSEITDEGLMSIEEMLSHNKLLHKFALKNCKMTRAMAERLTKGLASSSVRVLDLSHTLLGDEEIKPFAKLLEGGFPLESIKFMGSNVTKKGAALLASALEKNTHLLEFELSNLFYVSMIEDDGADLFAKALQNSSIRKLTLRKQGISEKGATKLIALLVVHRHLRSLDLSDNPIEESWAESKEDLCRKLGKELSIT